MFNSKPKAVLLLEDGSAFAGFAFAGEGDCFGEVVFNTAMSGYQETLTDPSYRGQIVTMSYPLIGNYGINEEDMESAQIHLEGIIVKEYQHNYSNWRAQKSLKAFLEEQGKLGVEGIDTRALVRKLRLFGAMKGVVATGDRSIAALQERLEGYPGIVGRDLVKEVSCHEPYLWRDNSPHKLAEGWRNGACRVVAVLDCGVKYNILRELDNRSCRVLVFPAGVTAETILSYKPNGVLLSNGPGDPAALPHIVATVKQLIGKVPIFGICLGHQILGQALGGVTAKLKFGHRGINQPVKRNNGGGVVITSQNHGFIVVPESLPIGVEKSFTNLNDDTSEGLAMPADNIFSVQYHPEASPGPHDANYLFDEFIGLIDAPQEG
ncbi:MAG: glutamine-hydrolyzing carbamoyl-phosphate synthase small subunit [Deltaproteobacteria bacterium]|nr:glutamine-hydrolyzing carbamoyl-phosphate synthase small subunit [Deltaproteobacteria bacterium]